MRGRKFWEASICQQFVGVSTSLSPKLASDLSCFCRAVLVERKELGFMVKGLGIAVQG